MGTNQETLIYIEDKDRLDASVAANTFAHSDVKNRVYINALGAKLGMKYLASEDIDVSNVYNLHSIKKILEETDIADIMLSNIHIDVRVVYDENAIFIPKSHFELGLTPDIYLVFQLAKDFSCVTFLGFFEPSLINKNNANADYYFIEKEKLSPVASLKNFVTNFNGNTNTAISDSEIENSERIIMAMADNDVSEEDKKYLIKQLVKSAELRDKFIEYENFETLSYKAMTDSMITKKEVQEDNITNFSALENIEGLEDIQSVEESNTEQELNQVEKFEDISLDDIFKDDIESLTNIENVENIGTEVKDIANDSLSTTSENNAGGGLSDIAGTVAGVAAGAIAGATVGGAISATAGEILSSINTAETAIDTVGEVAKAVSGVADVVSEGIDVAKSGLDGIMNNENINIEEPKQEFKEVHEENLQNVPQEEIQEEPISLEDIDISNIEEAELPQENIENETISLNDVEISDEVNTDFIDSIDNKISFDDIDLPSENLDVTDENVQPLNIEEDSISLDDIDISDLDKNLPQENEEPLISLDNTEEENLENTEVADNIEEPLEKIDELEEIDDISLDDTKDLSLGNEENVDNPENMENVEDIEDIKGIENEVEPLEDETTQEETSSGFGDALMNDLTNEELENITIDDLGVVSDENSENFEDLDEISSNDLLSQIDDVLNASATQEEPIEELPTENSQANTEVLTDETTEKSENIGTDSEEYSINDLLNELDSPEEVSDNAQVQQNEAEESIDKLLDNVEALSETIEDSSEASVEESENLEDESIVEANNDNENIVDDASDENSESGEANESGDVNEIDETAENGNLEMLFSDTDTESDMDIDEIADTDEQTVPGQSLFPQPKKSDNKKTLIVAAALVTVVAATSVTMFLKSKNNSANDIDQINSKQNEIVDNQVSATSQSTSSEDMLSTNTPNINQGTAQVAQTKQQVKELKNTAMNKKPASSGSYLQVNKLVWNVPDNLAYSPKMQNYLRATGKSMKLALSTDLLSASEYAYTNQMKVNLKIGSNGDIQQATVGSSSGSTQIDNIVLQSVKDTLSAVKPPSDEIKGQSFNLTLIIYF